MKQILEKLTSLVMKKYNLFHDELQSDVALSIILCARSIAGIRNDIKIHTSLLQKLNFEKWSKTNIKQHLQNITKGTLKKMLQIIPTASVFNKSECYILKTTLEQFIKNANMIEPASF